MKNPSQGTFIETVYAFNFKSIPNGLLEALGSSVDCFVNLPHISSSFSFFSC